MCYYLDLLLIFGYYELQGKDLIYFFVSINNQMTNTHFQQETMTIMTVYHMVLNYIFQYSKVKK